MDLVTLSGRIDIIYSSMVYFLKYKCTTLQSVISFHGAVKLHCIVQNIIYRLIEITNIAGAHTIGTTRCALLSRTRRLYNFTGRGDTDPSLNPEYAESLRKICPNPLNPATFVEMDPQSSGSFDSHYFKILNEHKGMFVSDAALLTNQQSAQMAQALENPNQFFARFAQSMKKMSEIITLAEGEGEVRKNCRVVN